MNAGGVPYQANLLLHRASQQNNATAPPSTASLTSIQGQEVGSFRSVIAKSGF